MQRRKKANHTSSTGEVAEMYHTQPGLFRSASTERAEANDYEVANNHLVLHTARWSSRKKNSLTAPGSRSDLHGVGEGDVRHGKYKNEYPKKYGSLDSLFRFRSIRRVIQCL